MLQDLETGEKFSTGGRSGGDADAEGGGGDDGGGDGNGDDDAEALRRKKAALKEAFNAEHDGRKNRGGGDGGEDGEEAPAKRPMPGREEETETYYDMVKRQMAEEQARTKEELSRLKPGARIALEGLRVGTYVRILLKNIPAEMVSVRKHILLPPDNPHSRASSPPLRLCTCALINDISLVLLPLR